MRIRHTFEYVRLCAGTSFASSLGVKVRDVIRLLRNDGWILVTHEGSHRQFKHTTKKGARHGSWSRVGGIEAEDPEQCAQAGRTKMNGMRYAVVIERDAAGVSAYVPDLPGCVAAGQSIDEVRTLIQGAIRMHVNGLRQDGEPVPEPSSEVEYIEA